MPKFLGILLRSENLMIWLGLSDYKWYRKWYGGLWECHVIETQGIYYLWMPVDRNYAWPNYNQAGSRGNPVVEDYPDKS